MNLLIKKQTINKTTRKPLTKEFLSLDDLTGDFNKFKKEIRETLHKLFQRIGNEGLFPHIILLGEHIPYT